MSLWLIRLEQGVWGKYFGCCLYQTVVVSWYVGFSSLDLTFVPWFCLRIANTVLGH